MTTQNTIQAPRKPGELDRDFGTDGTTTLNGSEVKALAVLKAPGADQGKIIGVIGDTKDFLLFRLEKNGLLDVTFAEQGYRRWGFGNTLNRSVPASITVLSDNKILVTGHAQEGSTSGSYAAAVRFNDNGTPDLTFGEGGVFIFKEQSPAAGNTSAPDPLQTSATGDLTVVETNEDGKILFCSYNTLAPYRDWGLLIRLTSTGALDTTLNDKGYVFFKLNEQRTSSRGLVTQTSGRIIVAGSTDTQGFLAGFTETGKIDITFGTNGFTAFDSSAGRVELRKLLLQSDNKPVAIGMVSDSSRHGWVTRTLNDGKPDDTFNGGEPLITRYPRQSSQWNAADLDPTGSIIVAGELSSRVLSLVGRITEGGALDPAFGKEGLSDPFAPGTSNFTTSAVVQSDTQIVIAGRRDNQPSVSRFHA